MIPAAFTPKSSSLVITPGKAIHQNALAVLRQDIEDDHPALAREVARPVVVRNHDLMIFGVGAGGDKRAAIARSRQLRRFRRLLPLIQPRHVVIRNLLKRVQGDDVIHIQIDAMQVSPMQVHPMRLHAVSNALQFLLILGVDVRPQHLARRLPKKLPIALRLVGIEKFDRFQGIGNLGSEQIAMLESNIGGRTFQMNIGPTTLLEAVSLLQARIGR